MSSQAMSQAIVDVCIQRIKDLRARYDWDFLERDLKASSPEVKYTRERESSLVAICTIRLNKWVWRFRCYESGSLIIPLDSGNSKDPVFPAIFYEGPIQNGVCPACNQRTTLWQGCTASGLEVKDVTRCRNCFNVPNAHERATAVVSSPAKTR